MYNLQINDIDDETKWKIFQSSLVTASIPALVVVKYLENIFFSEMVPDNWPRFSKQRTQLTRLQKDIEEWKKKFNSTDTALLQILNKVADSFYTDKQSELFKLVLCTRNVLCREKIQDYMPISHIHTALILCEYCSEIIKVNAEKLMSIGVRTSLVKGIELKNIHRDIQLLWNIYKPKGAIDFNVESNVTGWINNIYKYLDDINNYEYYGDEACNEYEQEQLSNNEQI